MLIKKLKVSKLTTFKVQDKYGGFICYGRLRIMLRRRPRTPSATLPKIINDHHLKLKKCDEELTWEGMTIKYHDDDE